MSAPTTGTPTSSSSRTTTRSRRRGPGLTAGSSTLSHNGQFKNVQARQVGGSLYQFEDHETGQPVFVVTDSRGKVVYRDRGNLVSNYTYDFETGEFNFLGNKIHGPHPMFTLDLCLAVAPLVAPFDSAKHLTERPIGLDQLREWLRRVPAAELLIHRGEESAAPVLQRSWRER